MSEKKWARTKNMGLDEEIRNVSPYIFYRKGSGGMKMELAQVMETMDKVVTGERRKELRDIYGGTGPIIGPILHRRLVGSAEKDAAYVVQHGGTPEEVRAMVEWLYVTIESCKHRMDFDRYRRDHNIQKILHKYVAMA